MSGKNQTRNTKPPTLFHVPWGQGEGMILPKDIAEVYQNIRQEKYLIHMIPNTVSAALCADGLSALGARPLMAVAPEEMEEIAAQADGCVVNLGQLNQEKIKAAGRAMKYTAKEKKPLVLDPAGCGASAFRLQAVQDLLEIPWKGMIKGNRSEIYSIQQQKLTKEGIDSLENHSLTEEIRPGSLYFVTGNPDCILWKGGRLEISHKKTPCQNIVGSGCLAGAAAGACSSAVQAIHTLDMKQTSKKSAPAGASASKNEIPISDMALAAVAASLGMEFALEYAGQAKGYGTAKSALLDGLSMLSEKCFLEWLNGKAGLISVHIPK